MKITIDKREAPWPICKLPNIFVRCFIFLCLPYWIYEDLKENKTIGYWWRSVTGEIIE